MRGAPWLLLSLLLLTGCSMPTQQTNVSLDEDIAEKLNDYHHQLRQNGFQGVVDIRRNGVRMLSEAYGQADASTSRPNQIDTRFRIGGVTRQITALAVLLLEQQGTLTLEDPVCKHLPTCTQEWQPITVGHLLLHNSGLSDYLDTTPPELAALFKDPPSHLALVEYLQGKPLDRTPGSGWKYSNSDYVVLGALIEHLSGEPYRQFVKRAILDPLDMYDTTTTWDELDPTRRAVGYLSAHPTAQPADPTPHARYADRVLSTTAQDLARWNSFLLTGKPEIANGDTRRKLLSPQLFTTEGGGTFQGYGFAVRHLHTQDVVYQSGDIPGFTAFNGIHPNTAVTVTILSNQSSTKANDMGHHLMSIVVPAN